MNYPNPLLKELYIKALREERVETCKDSVCRAAHIHKPYDKSVFEQPEYAEKLEARLNKDELYLATLSEDPFSCAQIQEEFTRLKPFHYSAPRPYRRSNRRRIRDL